MKILLLSHTGDVKGGAEQCLLEYVEVLRKKGYKCKVLVPKKGPMSSELDRRNVSYAVVGYGWATNPSRKVNAYKIRASTGNSLAHIFNEVEKYKPNLIITNTAVIPWGLYAGRAFGVPTVLLVHEILSEKDPSLDILPSYSLYKEILNQNTDYVVYNSKFVKAEYSKSLTLPATSADILYPLPSLDKSKIEALYQENTIGETLKLAVFGVLAPRKNQMEILQAARLLKSRGVTNFEIDLYGDKTANALYTRSLRTYISKYSLKDNVKIKGFTPNVYETMNEYNIILNSATYEPFGRTIIEGQLFGRVVISNNTGGGGELVEHGTTGLIYESGKPEDLAKKVKWVLENKDEAVRVGMAAKTKQFNKYVTEDRYTALTDAVDYVSRAITWDDKDKSNIYNPLLDLYSYNQQLNFRYAKVHRLVHNKVTRKGKSATLGLVTIAKKAVKKALT